MVKDLVSDGIWDCGLIRDLFEEDSVAAVLRLLLPRDDCQDIWIWTREPAGVFSVKSFLKHDQMGRVPSNQLLRS